MYIGTLDLEDHLDLELYIRISHFFEKIGFNQSLINNLYLPLFAVKKPNKLELIKESILNLSAEKSQYHPEIDLFNGINKSLLTPMVVIKGLMINQENIPLTECSAFEKEVYTLESDEIVRLNPKNLIKFYGYPEYDAKKLYSNISKQFHSCKDFYLVKKKFVSLESVQQCMILSSRSSFKVAWFNDKVQEFEKIFHEKSDVNIADIKQVLTNETINVKRLGWWMNVAKDLYESSGGDWSSLSSNARKHHVVNSIRHNAIGYHQSYSTLREKGFYTLAYDIVMREIITTFPTLRSVAQAQFNSKLKDGIAVSEAVNI